MKSIDLIVGGPPCQAYSLVGRAVKGEDIKNDPRNYLYKIYLQMLSKFKPKMFVFENVPGLLTANKGKYLEDIRKAFKDAGYNLSFRILNAKDFDVLQSRQRVILIGWLKGRKADMHYPEFKEKASCYVVKDIHRTFRAFRPAKRIITMLRKEVMNTYLKLGFARKTISLLGTFPDPISNVTGIYIKLLLIRGMLKSGVLNTRNCLINFALIRTEALLFLTDLKWLHQIYRRVIQ